MLKCEKGPIKPNPPKVSGYQLVLACFIKHLPNLILTPKL